MTAYNVVRFRVKPGLEQAFVDAHKKVDRGFSGMRRFSVVKTGDQAFCVIGEWENFDSIVSARPQMIGVLDNFRHMLEDTGHGITDPVSGTVVVEHMGAKPKRKAAKKAARKPAKKAAPKKKAAKKKRGGKRR